MYGLDYLSVRSGPSWSVSGFLEFCETPLTDEDGTVTGRLIERRNARIDRKGSNLVFSVAGPESTELARLAYELTLPVTRLDLRYDYGLNERTDLNLYALKLVERVSGYYDRKGIKITRGYWSGKDRTGNAVSTWTFGSRRSRYQLRIYEKMRYFHTGNVGVIRVEFQLRHKLASWIAETVCEFPTSQGVLEQAFASCESRLLEQGIFGFVQAAPLATEPEREARERSSREVWILTQVLPACLKEFEETGKNLPELLLKEFNAHFGQVAQKNMDYEALTRRMEDIFFDDTLPK